MPDKTVQYLALCIGRSPYLLACVRWPDIAQAITPTHPEWEVDPGIFDLPYEPAATTVTEAQALAIAAGWGTKLPSDQVANARRPALVRRMPADWSNLSPAEMRFWSLKIALTEVRAKAATLPVPMPAARAGKLSTPLLSRVLRRRRSAALGQSALIDLTEVGHPEVPSGREAELGARPLPVVAVALPPRPSDRTGA